MQGLLHCGVCGVCPRRGWLLRTTFLFGHTVVGWRTVFHTLATLYNSYATLGIKPAELCISSGLFLSRSRPRPRLDKTLHNRAPDEVCTLGIHPDEEECVAPPNVYRTSVWCLSTLPVPADTNGFAIRRKQVSAPPVVVAVHVNPTAWAAVILAPSESRVPVTAV